MAPTKTGVECCTSEKVKKVMVVVEEEAKITMRHGKATIFSVRAVRDWEM